MVMQYHWGHGVGHLYSHGPGASDSDMYPSTKELHRGKQPYAPQCTGTRASTTGGPKTRQHWLRLGAITGDHDADDWDVPTDYLDDVDADAGATNIEDNMAFLAMEVMYPTGPGAEWLDTDDF
ncbi:hypothetical protein BV22DRAFT_1050886 [Leucogyrophana mollusca]|uniref:Uncharacterized protein n=1 Tax=Leucogyrophana mollusca TaxID=85980 RepID=A0ACB8B3E5_9AGAM|nr:hypothetical protein BV22DRAFT_1050886 [Leucogyrophana mollusca]